MFVVILRDPSASPRMTMSAVILRERREPKDLLLYITLD